VSSGRTSIQSQLNINPDNSSSDTVYEFENFRLDAAHLMLYQDDREMEFAPKVVETLLALLERPNEIVSRDELMARLWKDSFVEEANLTQYIYLLRKALGKTSGGKDMIETLRRRGYRFNGKIRSVSVAGAQPSQTSTFRGKRNVRTKVGSLAVLPFENESADANTEYLSDGITETLINRLAEISALRVVARSTIFRYKGGNLSPQEVGNEIGVDAVLTGRVLRFDKHLIVRTELVDTVNGWQLWGRQYDRHTSDVLELQETISNEISENLRLKLSAAEQERMTKRYTESSEAYDLYIKGRYYLNKRLIQTIEQAAMYFQKAIDLDPSYAPAYIGLADCYPLLSLYGALTPDQAYPRARAAAEKALEIDHGLTKAYNALGVVKLFYEWDWPGAELAFQRAIELNPGYPDAHQRYGMFLTAMSRFDEAATEFEKARELDPLSLITITLSAYPYYYGRRFDKAVERLRDVIQMDENYSMAHFRLGLTFAQQRDFKNAVKELDRSTQLSGDRDTVAALGYVHGLAGDSAGANAALDELEERENAGFVSAYDRALVNVGLADHEAAIDWLERAYEERSYWLIYLKVDPVLDPLRGNPRFIALVQKVFGR